MSTPKSTPKGKRQKGSRPIGTSTTTRLRKIECEAGCGCSARVSRAVMLRGLMVCACGARLLPATLEDAALLHEHGVITREELERHPESQELGRLWDGFMQGQKGTGWRARNPRDPNVVAYERLLANRRTEAIANQRAAILPASDPIPF